MKVVPVRMGTDQNLKPIEFLRQFQGNLMGCFGGKFLLRREGLDHMIVHSPRGFLVEPFGVHELPEGSVRYTVYPGNQVPLGHFIPGFVFLFAVLHGAVESAAGLGFPGWDELNARHRSSVCVAEYRTADC